MKRADRARSARRDRQHLGLELPVLRRRQRVRAGAARRQRGALQAVGVRDAHRPAHRSAAARGRRSGRCVHHRSSVPARSARRCSSSASTASSSPARSPPARRSPRRWAARMVRAAARARRQGSRPTSPTTPTRRPRPSRSPTAPCTTPARAAARSSASTCTSGSTTRSSKHFVATVGGFKAGDPLAEGTYIGPLTRAAAARRARGPGGRRASPRARRCSPAASASSAPATGSSRRCSPASTTR